MKQDEDNPDPDELLRAIQKEEKQKKLGKLKIFFGMSAGVGKTYAMLEEAHQRIKEGISVVVGVVNTHGRKETEALLVGLPMMQEKWVPYKNTLFQEMDLETILEKKPQLVLVDELAHSNVPGGIHAKRWQDVIAILDAGIDVYTTLNVQHVESRKDIVENMTGVSVRETVPDLIFERASSIELIDISPEELLQRMREGKVYLAEQSKLAIENFFREENLIALREIALRFTAEKVDHDLHGILQAKGWKPRERIMVAISSSPSSEAVLRAARKRAFELDAPWVAVYVDKGFKLNDQEQLRLNRYFTVARDLGAEVITTYDIDVVAALERIARQKDITQIVVGRSPKKKFLDFFKKSIVDRLENENKHIDIIILRQEQVVESHRPTRPRQISEYWFSIIFVTIMTTIGISLYDYIGYKAVGFLFLPGIICFSLIVHRGPLFFATFLTAISWAVFIPTLFNHKIADSEDIPFLLSYFVLASFMGGFFSRMQEQEQLLEKREEKIEWLHEIEREILHATSWQDLRLTVISHLENHFQGKFELLMKGDEGQLIIDSQLDLLQMEKERATAIWVSESGKIGGCSTEIISSAAGVYVPMKTSETTVGVLAYFPKKDIIPLNEEIELFEKVGQKIAEYLHRSTFQDQINKQEYLRQVERVHRSVFQSINRGFYIPLESIRMINDKIRQESTPSGVHTLTKEIDRFLDTTKLAVDNIIVVSEIESGFIHFNCKNNSIQELIQDSVRDVEPFLNGHTIEVVVPHDQPLFLPFDAVLLQHALKNLLINALEYSHASCTVYVRLGIQESTFSLSVIDEGPGISEEVIPFIFGKFYQASNESKGLGLGLTIVKLVVSLHDGKIEVTNREKKGTEFSIILPRSISE